MKSNITELMKTPNLAIFDKDIAFNLAMNNILENNYAR